MHSGGYSSDINDYEVIEDVGRGKIILYYLKLTTSGAKPSLD